MKKVLVVLSVILLIAVPVFAEKGQFSVGLETGFPAEGVTCVYGINNELNAYATAGYNFRNGLGLALGAEYKVGDFKIDSEKFDVLVGGQIIPSFALGSQHLFNLDVYGTVAVAYDFTIKAESTRLDLTAFGRGGAGIDIIFGAKPRFGWIGSLGLVYHI